MKYQAAAVCVMLGGCGDNQGAAPGARGPACTFGEAPRPPALLAGSYGMAFRDVNNDGHPDLISFRGEAVDIRLGNGDGTFAAADAASIPLTGSTPANPILVDVTDVDLDGKPDIVFIQDYTTVRVARGNGDGTFQTSVVVYTVDAGSQVDTAAIADIDGSHGLDLVLGVTLSTGPMQDMTLVSLANAGDGTFSTVGTLPFSGFRRLQALVDLDGDSHADVVCDDGSVFPGNGDGTFSAARQVASGPVLAIGDVDMDGRTDLVDETSDRAVISVVLGRGGWTFAQGPTVTAPPGQRYAVVGDFDGDHKPDLVLADEGNDPTLHEGNGDGSFQPGLPFWAPDTRNAYLFSNNALAIGDIDNDGRADLGISGQTEAVVVVAAQGKDTYDGWQKTLTKGGGGPYATETPFAVGDIDGDGVPDIATEGTLLFGTGGGAFRDVDAPHAWGFTMADMNHDGRSDLVYGDMTVFLSNGDTTFTPHPNPQSAGNPGQAVTGDFNGDGKQDIAFGVTFENNQTHAFTFAIRVLLGDGKGGLVTGPADIPCTTYIATALAAFDANHDGADDLVYMCDALTVGLGGPGGKLRVASTFPYHTYYAVGTGDLDGDGHADLAIGNGPVKILLGKGDGTFPGGLVDSQHSDVRAVSEADITGDGKLDLVEGRNTYVSVLLGNGDGTFALGPDYWTGYFNYYAMAADLDGDKRPDLLALLQLYLGIRLGDCH